MTFAPMLELVRNEDSGDLKQCYGSLNVALLRLRMKVHTLSFAFSISLTSKLTGSQRFQKHVFKNNSRKERLEALN